MRPPRSYGKLWFLVFICHTMFQFWHIALHLEFLVLTYVLSIHKENFALYIECLGKLSAWYFVLSHINYAQWVLVHL